MSVLILEGVTGTGKSSTIEALQSMAAFELIDEEATFDGFMEAFDADPDAASHDASKRQAAILDKIELSRNSRHYLLERFHFSQLALGSDWKWYREVDERCAALQCKVAVLTLPENELASRSLYRSEYDGNDWQDLISQHGSEERALEVLRKAQSMRIEAIRQSRLPCRLIDASAKDWHRYAKEISRWMDWPLLANSGRHRP